MGVSNLAVLITDILIVILAGFLLTKIDIDNFSLKDIFKTKGTVPKGTMNYNKAEVRSNKPESQNLRGLDALLNMDWKYDGK